jgi:YD repeat-containing protein
VTQSAWGYAYDNHGRVSSSTDLRNGATAFTYNAADQVLTTTAPVPGSGDPAQVTTTFCDNQLRQTGQLLPDGTTATNQYYLTSLLKKTWGSRAYPVEYTYDPQGRMQTMKTWQSFAADSGTAETTWNYDLYRGWLSSKDYPDASTGNPGTAGPTYTYTDSGRLETRLWERGVTTTYGYNSAGDLNSITDTGGSVSTPSMTFTCDRRGGRATAMRNPTTMFRPEFMWRFTEGRGEGRPCGFQAGSHQVSPHARNSRLSHREPPTSGLWLLASVSTEPRHPSHESATTPVSSASEAGGFPRNSSLTSCFRRRTRRANHKSFNIREENGQLMDPRIAMVCAAGWLTASALAQNSAVVPPPRPTARQSHSCERGF